MLAWPATYSLDAVLAPALTRARRGPHGRDRPPAPSLPGCLDARLALPLAPPADWARDGTLTCKCRHCADLGRCLVHPARQGWSFEAIQGDRSHVESTILSSKCDLDCMALRKGSPHTLVCTKNRASYERRAKQREGDLADHARLARGASAAAG